MIFGRSFGAPGTLESWVADGSWICRALGIFSGEKHQKKQDKNWTSKKEKVRVVLSQLGSFPLGFFGGRVILRVFEKSTPQFLQFRNFRRFGVTFLFRMLKGEEVFFASLSASRAAPWLVVTSRSAKNFGKSLTRYVPLQCHNQPPTPKIKPKTHGGYEATIIVLQ